MITMFMCPYNEHVLLKSFTACGILFHGSFLKEPPETPTAESCRLFMSEQALTKKQGA